VPKRRLIRDEPLLPDAAVLVRALTSPTPGIGEFDRTALLEDLSLNFDLFGYYGLSCWGQSADWSIDRILRVKAVRAERMALLTAGALRAQGLGIVPSGKYPHYDVTLGPVYDSTFGGVSLAAPNKDDFVDRILRAPYTVEQNRHYRQDTV
jgi:hypothetical protein